MAIILTYVFAFLLIAYKPWLAFIVVPPVVYLQYRNWKVEQERKWHLK